MAGYKYYDNLISLVHFDGAENSTSIVDTAGSPPSWSVTFGGKLTSSTRTPKFGSTCLYAVGGSDGIVSAAAVIPGSSDYTVEMWVYSTSVGGGADYYLSQHNGAQPYFRGGMDSGGNPWMTVPLDAVSTGSLGGSPDIPLNQWFHWAVSRSGNTYRLFVNGVLRDTKTFSGPVTQAQTYVGRGTSTETASNVWVDEFAVHNICKYTASFTPPTGPYKDYPLNDKLIPRKDLHVRKPLRVNGNNFIHRVGI